MKQLFFDGKGQLLLQEVPAPQPHTHGALVRVHASLISSGTEMANASGGGSLIRKAIEQPHLIKRAVELAVKEGLAFTARAVKDVSEMWLPTGYSSAGEVVACGPQAEGFTPGERVACAGVGFANHAGFNAVPHPLMAHIPEGVTYQEAAFTTLAAIALQGVRRAEVTLGETVVVVGLGLIGQLTVQLLAAAGCRVIASDLIHERRELAAKLAKAEPIDPTQGDAAEQVMALTAGIGADKVILTAATRSSDPTNAAFEMCRERGRVVMVGAMGMDLDRTTFYNRELDFVISRSTGPGRYDRDYEERGHDYPIGFVRWTEQRNMQAALNLMAAGKLRVKPLITAVYPIEEAHEAYSRVAAGSLAVLLTYGQDDGIKEPIATLTRGQPQRTDRIRLGLVGAGSFAKSTHIPHIEKSPLFELAAVVSGSGSAAQLAEAHDIPLVSTDLGAVLQGEMVDAVLISTRHHLHAEQATQAATAGKHVFVEKPMALTDEGCQTIIEAAAAAGSLVTVGFNRRAAPTAIALKEALDGLPGPKHIVYRINAGPLPPQHWLNDPIEGGGRLLGEGVHFIDFVCGMIGSRPVALSAQASADWQDFTVIMRFAEGSLGTVIYTARGNTHYPKERIEAFGAGGTALLEDFKSIRFYGMQGRSISGSQNKGHAELLSNFGQAIRGQAELIITAQDGLRATRLALWAMQAARGTLHD